VAVVDGPRRDNAASLRAEAAALVGGLQRHGVRRGDVVAWQLPNWRESTVLFWACWQLGAIAAPLHHRSGEREVTARVAALRPRVTFAAPGLPACAVRGAFEVRGDGGYDDLLTGPTAVDPTTARGASLESDARAAHDANAGTPRTSDELVGDGWPSVGGGPTEPYDPAAVLFTAGSTGEPKGVIHTHRSLVHKARTMPRVHGLTADDAVLMPAPLAHVSGLLNGVLVPVAAAMKVVLMERWDPATALDLIAAEQVSFMVGPPTFFLDLLDAPSFSPERVASLRLVSCGGTGVTASFVEDASRRLGARVKRSYGSTEAPTVTTWHDGDQPDRAATTDGRPVADVELQVVAPGTGAPLPAGRTGELRVRGTAVCAGYLDRSEPERASRPVRPDHLVRPDRPVESEPPAPADRPSRAGDPVPAGHSVRGDRSAADRDGTWAATGLRYASSTRDGWFATGDLAVIDEEGWLTVMGRVDDVIIRGGENIAPTEVEAVLEAHPGVHRAVAVGLPDERLGQVVAAAVVADPAFDLDACRAWFAAHGVARHKTPTRLLHLGELPILASGKPDRRAVRARFYEGGA
jgi:cyclohexanecarboxylate-CoA ligase